MSLRDILLGGSANRQTIIHFPNGEQEDIDSGIYSGSMKLNRILCNSSNLQYGECNAAGFQAQIANISDLSGVKIYVYQKIDTETVPLFTGIIDSCKAVRNKSYRKLEAYDIIYSVSSRNVVDWYNDLFEKNTSYTLKQFRDSFFAYVGIEQEYAELINDDIIIEKTIQTDSLKAGDVMYAVCQINVCFGNITPEGRFRYIDLAAGETYNISDNIRNTTSYEEYVTKPIDKLMVLSDEDELNVSVGSGDNTYTIKGNFLLYGYETESLRTVAGRIFQKIRYVSYRPADIKTILSEINIQLGDKIIVTDNNISFTTYVLKERFSGTQLLSQTIQADGEEKYADVINDVNGDIKELKLKQSTILSSLQTEYLKAETAELTYIKATELTTVEANIKNAIIGSLSTEFATVKYLETNYARINLANVEKATVGTVLADVGLITSATITDGHVTGYLDSVNINANSITAGDLSVERLIIRGSKNSIVYALNNITGALQAQNTDTINGEALTRRTVTADRLVAGSITAGEIAAGAITADKIASKVITADKINISNLSSISANLGTITAGIIQSNNYISDRTGMQLNLANGVWDSKYFKISSDGKITSTGGVIGNWNISGTMLTATSTSKIQHTAGSVYDYSKANPVISVNAFYNYEKIEIDSEAVEIRIGSSDETTIYSINAGGIYNTTKNGDSVVQNCILGFANESIYTPRLSTGRIDVGKIYALNGNIPQKLSVGGYNNTSYALSAASLICNSWIRTVGSTGWYNETYGGGWYMSDTTWIRAHNNKSIYTGGTIQGNVVKTSSGANLDTINNNYPVKYIKKTYSNVSGWTTGTVNYKILDTFTALGVPSGKKVVSINIIGWSGAPGMFNVIQNSAGTAPVLICTGTGSFASITIQIAYQ